MSDHDPQEFALELSATDVASIFNYANVDQDLLISLEEFIVKFNIQDAQPINRREWCCKSDMCTQELIGYDEYGIPNSYDEAVMQCPICGADQVVYEALFLLFARHLSHLFCSAGFH